MRKLMVAAAVVGLLMVGGAFNLQAEERHSTEGRREVVKAKAAPAKVSREDIAAVAKAIDEARKLLAEGKTDEAAKKLDEAAALLTKVQSAAARPAPAATGESGTFTGVVETTHSQKRPRLVVAGVHYELKPSENADATVSETPAQISKGEATGRYVVKGTETTIDGRKWLLVDSISKE